MDPLNKNSDSSVWYDADDNTDVRNSGEQSSLVTPANLVKDGETSSDTSSATEREENADHSSKEDGLCPGDNKPETEQADEYQELEYTVGTRDTLNSIAAKHNTTPSRLKLHNRLSSTFVFAGQILKMPPPEPEKPPEIPIKKKESATRQASVPIPEEPEIFDSQFVKINVRHITDGKGIVAGSLLLTPKSVMFNPSPNDPLVQEDQVDYQIVLPSELIQNIAILKDFIRFRFKDFNSGVTGDDDVDDSLIFRGTKENIANEAVVDKSTEEATNETDTAVKGDSTRKAAKNVEEGQPLYLRFLMGKPIGKKLPRNYPIVSYGDEALEPQYWFIITSAEKAVHVCSFIDQSCPKEKYGRVDVLRMEKNGYELIREGMKVVESEAGMSSNRETIAKSKLSKMLTMTSVDFTENTEIIGTSELMNLEDMFTIACELPPKVDGHPWVLKHSTSRDGFNLHSLTRKLAKVTTPVLILIQECGTNNEQETCSIFGALLSTAPKRSEHFEGTGETFVFKLKPDFKAFKWTGENTYFYKLDGDCMIVGSSKGSNAIWLDADLYQGRTRACATFDNPPLIEGREDFTLKVLECWAFET